MAQSLILPHEHVFCRHRSSDRERAKELVRGQMRKLADGGVTDLVDLTAYTNPLSFRDFQDVSPVRLHACVGFYLERFVDRRHRTLSVDGLIEVLHRKWKRLRPVNPAVAIKVAASSGKLSSFEQRAFEAVARFHALSGLPVVTHSTSGFETHQDFLVGHGVKPAAIMLSHPEMATKGRFTDPEAVVCESMARCADRGSYLCFTDFTGASSSSDALRLRLFAALVNAGHVRQLVVSGDSSWRVHRGQASVRNAARGHDYTLIFDVYDKLRRAGVDDAQLWCIKFDNPRRFFASLEADDESSPWND